MVGFMLGLEYKFFDLSIYSSVLAIFAGGRGGIRTPGGFPLNGFQDRRNRPLCHLSKNCAKYYLSRLMSLYQQLLLVFGCLLLVL